jgi:hypothetical protein
MDARDKPGHDIECLTGAPTNKSRYTHQEFSIFDLDHGRFARGSQQPRQILNLLSSRLSCAVTTARVRAARAERGTRIAVRRTARILGELKERGATIVLPYPGDAGVTGIAACDGSAGILEALPMPLGSYTVLLLAGPAGMPEIAELPAPAEPASGVVCASDNAGENTTNRPRARTADLRSIEVSFRGD